jgi:hypothetical protein
MLSDAPGIYFSVGIGDLKRLLKTPQGIALSFEEWATHQAKHESQHVEAPTGLGNHEQRDQWIRLQGSLRLMEKLSEAHGFSTSTNGSERNVFESGFIIVPEHPCGGDIAYEFDKVLLLNLANADAASIQVDASLVKFEVSLFYEAANFKQLQNGKEKSGAVSVTFDSGQNALEFARLLNEAVAICRERKSQDQSF